MKKTISAIFIAAVLFAACSKDRVDMDIFEGTWYECYDDPNFSFDGSVVYSFSKGTYTVESTSFLLPDAGTHKSSGRYVLDGKVVNLYSESSNSSFTVVKLTSKEMEWQRVGTAYSRGTLSSDFKHFSRVK